MTMQRRQFLTALGLGAASVGGGLMLPGAMGWGGRAQAGGEDVPARLLLWITPHGTVPNAWAMSPPGLPASGTGVASIATLEDAAWSRILAPLAPFKQKLSIVEGIARTSAIDYERRGAATSGWDLNRHHFGQASLLTCVDPLQRAGSTCIGGGESVDQVIGRALAQPGRWASRVYGANHQHPYNFVAAGEAAPRVTTARQAYDDLMGVYMPPDDGGDPRVAAIQRGRASALDLAAREYDAVAPRLGTADRQKLERHAQLLRDLEISFRGTTPGASCSPTYEALGHEMDRFARVMSLVLGCDMTRMVSFVTMPLRPEEFGLPVGTNVHQDYAHNSVAGPDAAFTAEAERGMIEYNLFYARRFAYLLEQLDSVPEGDGTLLDHTAVVWISELGTGTHWLHDMPVVIAGGANGVLRTGQYVRYARSNRVRQGYSELSIGPAQNQLYVTLMRALGMDVDAFGAESTPLVGGGSLSLRGTLPELLV
ncbi:DUF1552 domain-containing protein [Sandaracinus amylolyticus]|nr:DUF1552 domain-containing protein [Sandaracinus amylolyticus]